MIYQFLCFAVLQPGLMIISLLLELVFARELVCDDFFNQYDDNKFTVRVEKQSIVQASNSFKRRERYVEYGNSFIHQIMFTIYRSHMVNI
jgi:hypothetical protein